MIKLCLILNLLLITGSDSQCHGERGEWKDCCNGYRWDRLDQKCIKCRIGFFGEDCEKACRYPNYGENCQLHCTCEKTFCDPANGCRIQEDITTINISKEEIQTLQSTIHTSTGNASKPDVFQTFTILFVILVVLLIPVLMIFPIGFLIYKNKKLRIRTQRFDQGERSDGKDTGYSLQTLNSTVHTDGQRTENLMSLGQHSYEEMSSANPANSQSQMEVYDHIIEEHPDKGDDVYLTPI